MRHTVFQQPLTRAVLESRGIVHAPTPDDADVLVANSLWLMGEFLFKPEWRRKKLLIWTQEPRFWESPHAEAVAGRRSIRVMSVYSGEIFRNNYYYARIPQAAHEMEFTRVASRKVVCVARAFQPGEDEIEIDGRRIDLTRLRTEVALYGHRQGAVDIYGRHWPSGVSLGESRGGAWVEKKYDLIRPYKFNLCFENTLWPFYCTEKLWQAIYCGCLPIYYGQASIYDDFPRESFIDYAEIGSPAALFEIVGAMSNEELSRRYAACLDVFQRAYARGDEARIEVAEYTAAEIKRMCGRRGRR
jgi:hypothetical protein